MPRTLRTYPERGGRAVEVLVAEGAPVVQLDGGEDGGDLGVSGGVQRQPLLQQPAVQVVLGHLRRLLLVEALDLLLRAGHAAAHPVVQLPVPHALGGVGEVVGAHADEGEDLAVEAGVLAVLELADRLGLVAAGLVGHARQAGDPGQAGVGGASGGLACQVHLGLVSVGVW